MASSLVQGNTPSTSLVASLVASPSATVDRRDMHQLESPQHSGHSTPSPSGDIEFPRDVNGKLIKPSSSHFSRSPRLPLLPPLTDNLLNLTPPGSAIPASTEHNYSSHQDVREGILNSSGPYSTLSPTASHNVYPSSTTLESEYSDPSHDDPLNQHSTRPWTSTQVFPRLPDLAAHYGIPQLLPPAPRTTPRRPSFPSPSASNHTPDSFSEVCSNYLTMLSQKPEDTKMAEDTTPVTAPADLFASAVSTEDAVQTLYDVLSASPEFTTSPDFAMSEFLTSPWEDSPLDDLLTTPAMDSADLDMLTSPLLTDTGDMTDMNLFGGLFEPFNISKPAPLPQLDDLYTFPSPVTPSLDPSSLYASPRQPSTPSFPAPTSRRKNTATGTRRNITPDSLVPLDAPTQPRKYVAPSATSRKELPAIFAKKRARTQAFGDDEDELPEEPLPPNATEKEQIEWKRRQNTLAARKSRKRKLQHQLELESTVEQLTAEKETWRIRALTYQALLKNHGHDVPDFS